MKKRLFTFCDFILLDKKLMSSQPQQNQNQLTATSAIELFTALMKAKKNLKEPKLYHDLSVSKDMALPNMYN